MLVPLNIAPLLSAPVLQPEDRRSRIRRAFFAIRDDKGLAACIEDFNGVIFIANGTLIQTALNPIIGLSFSSL